MWEVVKSCQGNANGALCWQASSNTSTRAMMKRHIAHPIPWHHGTASREHRWLVKSIDRMPFTAGTMMDVGPGHGDQGVAPGIVLRCQAKRGEPDTPVVPHPTYCHGGTTVQRNSFPQAQTPHPSSPQLCVYWHMPGLAALQGVWSRPCWMMMRRRRTFRHNTPPCAMWSDERRVVKANQLLSEWRPQEEVQHGG